MNPSTNYTPTENGFLNTCSQEYFNRLLYGSHANDDKEDKFATFAGDVPQFMGSATDWTVHDWCDFGKRGTLSSGLCLTPGQRIGGATEVSESGARWFHHSEDVVSEFKNGWMEYKLSHTSDYFPNVMVNIEAYPLLPDDGFLVHYRITTDQRIVFAAGFGGITDYFGNFCRRGSTSRYFRPEDCEKNVIELGKNRACVSHPSGASMRIGTSFPAEIELGSAKAMAELSPALFLGSTPENTDESVVKISAVIEQGQVFDGFIVAIHNTDDETLNKWLAMEDPMTYIKQQIYAKHVCINLSTPDHPLDLTIAPTVIAMDASFHRNSFHHGTFTYHSPFLGWRALYAPTTLGWSDKVEEAMSAHLNQIVKKPEGEERIWYDGKGEREAGPEAPSPYHQIENTYGYLPYFLGLELPYYNMQECAFDMMLYHIEWSGNLEIAEKYFDEFCAMLDWEERIFDPDNDGLYQNFLNTWISDGHSYNGAGCAQSSAYNYRANMVMAKIAERLGKPSDVFVKRAEKIKKAMNEKLWLANTGVIAESIDTMGNCQVHPSPELNTTYLAIDCGAVNDFKAYTMLKYTENYIENITTPGTGGRLVYSSNWYPRKYSTCGLFPAENACLALAYYQLGLEEKGKEILDGLVDCYFTGTNPGMASHVQSNLCTDAGDTDFTDVSSTYLRMMVEGLFGIRINNLDNCVTIAPNLPKDWEHANLTLKDVSLNYNRTGNIETFDIYCDRAEKKYIKIPMRATSIEAVMLDGEVIPYEIKAGITKSFIVVETEKQGRFQLRIMHGKGDVPTLKITDTVLAGNDVAFEIKNGEFVEYLDICETLEDITVVGNKVYAKTKNIAGHHTFFIRVKSGQFDSWLAADYEIIERDTEKTPVIPGNTFQPVDISKFFNCNMTEIHNQEFLSPRPEGYSIGLFPNGRYAWEWNQGGHNKVVIDDSTLRAANGMIYTNSGIPFITPAENENIACVSLWDNFPTEIAIPLEGKGNEIAVLFAATTNAMQSYVENVRITVEYADGDETSAKLVYPINIDDWLVSALQKENETFYFSKYNHAIVQRISLDPNKTLANIKIEAIANEVIMGVMGVSISK